MKRFLLDTVFCTLFIFGIIGIFSSVTYFRVFDLFDPIGDMFSDFEISDLVMSQLREPPLADEDIVMVNIAYAPREDLGYMIHILEQYDPAVIGVDVTFERRLSYQEDSVFVNALEQYDNIVLGNKLWLLPNDETGAKDTVERPATRIAENADFGFANLLTDAENQDEVKTNRNFVVKHEVMNADTTQYALAVKLAYYKNPELTQEFLDRNNKIESVNYKGNVVDFGRSEFGTRYFVLDIYDVFDGAFSEDLIKDKVVIMCFMGKHLGDQSTRDDLYFTPLNKNYVGKAEPDMFGGVIHANIVSMILEEDYINAMSKNTGTILAVLICLINVFCFKIIYGALPRWYDGITKIIQLMEVVLMTILMIWLFNSYNYKADFTFAIILVLLSGDSIEVYHGVVKNLLDKKERKKLFQVNKNFWKESH